jgi:hypothetical protein
MQARTRQTRGRPRQHETGTARVVRLVSEADGSRPEDDVYRDLVAEVGPGRARQALNFAILARYVTADRFGNLRVEADR